MDFDGTSSSELGFAVSLIQTQTQANYCGGTPPVLPATALVAPTNPECSTWDGQDYLDYPGGMRLYIRPEQFTWFQAWVDPSNTVTGLTNLTRNAVVPVTTNQYRIQSFFLLDMDARSMPTALTNDDVVALYINNESGNITTLSQEGINSLRIQGSATGTALTTWPCSFYDVHKGYNSCNAVGGFATLGA